MTPRRRLILAAFLLVLIASGLRFYRLGSWPFGGDELSTIAEADALVAGEPPVTQVARLPRAVPLGHLIHATGYRWLGRDEWASRVPTALSGTFQCLLVFILLNGLLGHRVALATGALLAVWPEHVYYSQYNRFYIFAGLAASLCMLLGAWAVQRRSSILCGLACLAGLAALLCHTLTALVLVGVLVALVAVAQAAQHPLPRRLFVAVGVACLAVAGFTAFYLAPLLRGWNSGVSWGASPLHSLLASLSQVGWPVALLAGVGGVLAWKADREQGRYWVTFAGLWVFASLALPLVLSYHSAYHVPLSLGVFVLAGITVVHVGESLRMIGTMPAAVWFFAVMALNLPALVSHYRDGSRIDYRTPAAYLARHLRPGDQVAALGPSCLRHYLANAAPAVGLSEGRVARDLDQLLASDRRLWIVLSCGRSGHPAELQRWLDQHARRCVVIRKERFDHRNYVAEVYLALPDVRATAARQAASNDGSREGGM
jgi:predicted membrane-bound mannosyltransferase